MRFYVKGKTKRNTIFCVEKISKYYYNDEHILILGTVIFILVTKNMEVDGNFSIVFPNSKKNHDDYDRGRVLFHRFSQIENIDNDRGGELFH